MKKTTKSRTFKKRISIIALVVFGILLLSGYYFRYSVRTSVVPGLVSTFYKHGIVGHFNKEVGPFNDHLKDAGITFDDPDFNYFICDNNAYDVNYSGLDGLAMTINCDKESGSHEIHVDQSFLKRWKLQATNLESYLHKTGWHQEANSLHVSLAMFYEAPTKPRVNDSNEHITYAKTIGSTECAVSVWRSTIDENGAFTEDVANQRTKVFEGCERDISFFGGYQPNSRYPK